MEIKIKQKTKNNKKKNNNNIKVHYTLDCSKAENSSSDIFPS